MFNSKEKIPSISSWVSTLQFRLRWLLSLQGIIRFYRAYEPKWLAKITDPSYRFQLLVDETIDSYLEKNNVRCIKGTWCDPGLNTDYCLFVKSNDWTEDEKQTFKRGLENSIHDIWGYGRYPNYWMQDSHHLHLSTKYGQMNWQWHFVNSIIKSELFGHYEEYMSEDYYNSVYKGDEYDNES